MCENCIGLKGMLILGAVIELVRAKEGIEDTLIPETLRQFQKTMKYGLKEIQSIALYEMGFSDRVISQKLSDIFIKKGAKVSKNQITEFKDEFHAVLDM